MADRPTGTVTFLFTDVEGSTRLWQEHPEAMRDALAQHDRLLRDAVDRNNGSIFTTGGDSFAVAFADPLDAVRTALGAQQALSDAEWGEVAALRVRMALDTGLVQQRDDDYFGPPLNRVARIEELAGGGQILVSNTTADLVRYSLPEGVVLEPLGEHKLRDVERRVPVFRLEPEPAAERRRGPLLGGLIGAGAALAVFIVIAVVLATRSTPATSPVTSVAAGSESVGEPVWSVSIPGLSVGPFLDRGGVYAIASDEDTTTLYGLDAATGDERWKFEAEGALRGRLHSDGRALYFLSRATRAGDRVWVVDPSDGTHVAGCGLKLASTNNAIAVTSKAVYALSAGGPAYMIPTDAGGSGRCHDMATENRTFAMGPPALTGPLMAGSTVLIGDSRSIYQLDADDLAVIAEYFPAEGQVESYRGAVDAIGAVALRIQSPTAIVETTLVYAVDGEGLLHASPDGLEAMAPTDKTVAWAPLVDESGVILIDSEGTLASYSHDLSALHGSWPLEGGTIRDAQLHDGVVYVTDDSGVKVIDVVTGLEMWTLETGVAMAATGAEGWILVRTDDDLIAAYALDDAAPPEQPVGEPLAERDIAEPLAVNEEFFKALNEGDQAAVFRLIAADADMFESSLLKEATQEDLAFWWEFPIPWSYEIEITNCSITEEGELGTEVRCDAVAHGRVEDVLGTEANGYTRLWIVDGLVRGPEVPGFRVGEDDYLWWLLDWGFFYLPTPSYQDTVKAFVEWADNRYGEDWNIVCEETLVAATVYWGLGDAELAGSAECAALQEEIATEYVAQTSGS